MVYLDPLRLYIVQFNIVNAFTVHAIAVTGSHFGNAQEIHQLKQWNCEATDTVLAYCGKTIALSPCSPSQTAGVYCQGTVEKSACKHPY